MIYIPQDQKKILGQLVFVRFNILPINHVADWRYILQSEQTEINKDVTGENNNRTNHDYRVVNKAMTNQRAHL